MKDVTFRLARAGDEARLEAIRAAAFAPVFASFRRILGDEIYEAAQQHEDDAQAGLLTSLLAEGSTWDVLCAERDGALVGFVAVRYDYAPDVGEIGLNAVHPDAAGRGVGTALYERAIEEMRARGVKVATVATGGDPSHTAARRAYRKVGFDVEIPSVWMCRTL